MGTNVQIPDDLHAKLKKLSDSSGIKIKALVASAIRRLLLSRKPNATRNAEASK